MKKLFFPLVIVFVLLAGCGPVTPYPTVTPVIFPAPILTATPIPSPTARFYLPWNENYLTPSPTPAPVQFTDAYSNLEVITPENIGQMKLIDKWGKGNVYAAVISPDKKMLAVSTGTGVYLYNAGTLDLLGVLNVPPLRSSALMRQPINFSPDGKILAVGGNGITFWDVGTQKYVGTLPTVLYGTQFTPMAIQFTPDDNHIFVASFQQARCGGNIALYSLQGYRIFDKDTCEPVDESGEGPYYRFTVDNKAYLFMNSSYGRETPAYPDEVLEIDLSSNQLLNTITNNPQKRFYDISPDGNLLAYRVGTQTQIVDAKTDQIIQTVDGDIEFVQSPDGKISWQYIFYSTDSAPSCGLQAQIFPKAETNPFTLVFSSFGDINHGLQLWDLSTCSLKKSVSFPCSEFWPVFDPTGKFLAAETGNSDYVWNVKNSQYLYDLPGSFNILGFNSDGSRIIVGEVAETAYGVNSAYKLRVIDSSSGNEVSVLAPTGKGLSTISPSFDPSIILVLDSDGLNYWDIDAGRLIYTSREVQALAFAPNKQDLAYTNIGNAINILNLSSGKLIDMIRTSLPGIIGGIQYSSDGSKIAVKYAAQIAHPYNYSLSIFDIASGKLAFQIDPKPSWISFFSPNQFFSEIERNDGYVELWDFNQNHPIQTVLDRDFHNAYFSSNGTIFVTSTKFWDVQTGKLLFQLSGDYLNFGVHMAFSPDGRIIAVTNVDGTVDIWGVEK